LRGSFASFCATEEARDAIQELIVFYEGYICAKQRTDQVNVPIILGIAPKKSVSKSDKNEIYAFRNDTT